MTLDLDAMQERLEKAEQRIGGILDVRVDLRAADMKPEDPSPDGLYYTNYSEVVTALLAVRAAKREEVSPESLPPPCRCGGGYTVSDRGTCDHCKGIVIDKQFPPPAESSECEHEWTRGVATVGPHTGESNVYCRFCGIPQPGGE